MHGRLVVPQLQRADRHLLDRAHGALDLDVFARAKRVIHKKEDARDDIRHQLLRAKSNGETDTGQQLRGVDAASLRLMMRLMTAKSR